MRRTTSRHHTFSIALAVVIATGSTACSRSGDPDLVAIDVGAPARADAAPQTAFGTLTSDAVELVDLTYPLSPDSLYWPTGAPFTHEYAGEISEGGYWYASGSFSSPEHLGTHLDAPIHFGEGQWTSDQIPLSRLIADGIVIDISERAARDADTLLTPEDIAAWEERHGTVPGGSIVIVRTGWASRWPDWNAYYGTETPQDVATLHFPGLSPEAARVLGERGIFGLGIDTASIDPGTSSSFEAHRVLAAANVFNLENLTNVDGLPEEGFGVMALPMKIEQGTGGPTRVVAVVAR